MNKTLYVKDSDAPVWEEAEKLVPNGVSALVTSLLAGHLERNRPPDAGGFERLEVEVREDEDKPIIRKAFIGRWLIPPSQGFEAYYSDEEEARFGLMQDAGARRFYAVAQTKKGKLAVYRWQTTGSSSRPEDTPDWAELSVFDSFDEFADSVIDSRIPAYPAAVVSAVAELLGQPYSIELDI